MESWEEFDAELDVADLPSVVFGLPTYLVGNVFYMMPSKARCSRSPFASYFFLRTRVQDWPPGLLRPTLTLGTINLIIFVLSVASRRWVQKVAQQATGGNRGIGLDCSVVRGRSHIVRSL